MGCRKQALIEVKREVEERERLFSRNGHTSFVEGYLFAMKELKEVCDNLITVKSGCGCSDG